MSWVAAGMASGAATHAAVVWAKKKRDAKRDEKNRPKFEISKYDQEALMMAKADEKQGLPEEQLNQWRGDISQGMSQALSASSSRKGGLSGISTLNQNQNEQYAALLSMNAQARMGNRDKLKSQLGYMGDLEGQKFQFNEVNPFYERIAARNKRDAELSQSLSNAAQMGVGSIGGGGKQGQQGQQPPSNLGKDLSLQKGPGYNPNTGLTNPSMVNQSQTQYGTMNTDTGLTNPWRTQNKNPYFNPYSNSDF